MLNQTESKIKASTEYSQRIIQNCIQQSTTEWNTLIPVTKPFKYSENPKSVQISADGSGKSAVLLTQEIQWEDVKCEEAKEHLANQF